MSEQLEKILSLLAGKIARQSTKIREKKDEPGTPKYEKAVLEEKMKSLANAENAIHEILDDLEHGQFMTECCDAHTKVNPFIHSFSQGYHTECLSCGEENPETYKVEVTVEDIIERLQEELK